MVSGLSHITFVVRDLDRMEMFLTRIFGARKIYDSGDATFSIARERFFLIGRVASPDPAPIWIAIMEGAPLPVRSYNHVAFKIDASDYDAYLEKIRGLGIEISEGRPRTAGEGRSIYFHDEDNHLFELHTGTLPERLARYLPEPTDAPT